MMQQTSIHEQREQQAFSRGFSTKSAQMGPNWREWYWARTRVVDGLATQPDAAGPCSGQDGAACSGSRAPLELDRGGGEDCRLSLRRNLGLPLRVLLDLGLGSCEPSNGHAEWGA
eukprot:2156303-Rhodomonas_salina.1